MSFQQSQKDAKPFTAQVKEMQQFYNMKKVDKH